MSSLGALADTVPSTILDDEIPCLVNPPRMSYCIGLKYHPGPWMAIGPDGALWSGRSDGYRLDRSRGLAPTALPRVSIRPPREALPIDEGLGAAMDGPARERFGDLPSFDETYPFPTHKPAVARVLPTRDGTVWVRLHAPSEPTIDAGGEEVWIETESRFDIFTPEGEHVGYVTGPAEMWIQDIRGDTVLATRVGDYGVPYVERFIIVWSDPN